MLMAGALSKSDLQSIRMNSLGRSQDTMASDTPHMHLSCPFMVPLHV